MQNPKSLRIANAPLYAALLCLAAGSLSFGQFETAPVLGSATDPRAGVISRAHYQSLAAHVHADFISTDQVEDVAKVIGSTH